MSNSSLVLADFYNPSITIFTKIIMDATNVIQMIMLPFIQYDIIQNANMKIYRFYLLNGILWNTIMGISYGIISPVLLGVYPMVLIYSFLEHFLDMDGWYTFFEVFALIIGNTCVALPMSVA